MDTSKIAEKLKKKLQKGDMKIIARMSGVKIVTVYAVMEGRRTRPVSDVTSNKVFKAAIELLKGREQDEYELNSQIDKI